jgi:hypothetical protein
VKNYRPYGRYYLCKFTPFFAKKMQKECHQKNTAILTCVMALETLVNQGAKDGRKIIKKC